MHCLYYELCTAPDFSLAKYSSLSETGPGGVLIQHNAFWRQIHQWGKLFGGSIHFLYEYNPEKPVGERLHTVIRFDANDKEALRCAKEVMNASVLAPYYSFLHVSTDLCISPHRYKYRVHLMKSERFVRASSDENAEFYLCSKWEMNESARLYSMLRMMETAQMPCVYCVDLYPREYTQIMEKQLSYVMPRLRNLTSYKISASQGQVTGGGRDEEAKKAVKYYEDVLDTLASSPHFLVNIQMIADNNASAHQILNASAAEAIAEGNHAIFSEEMDEQSRISIFDVLAEGFFSMSSPEAPKTLSALPHLMTVEEVLPFAVFPVLYPGEDIEMLKETVPPPQDGITLGRDTKGHIVKYPWKLLSKHAFLSGMPGSGKTNAMMYLISEIHKAGIPVLVLEPAKKEYRSLSVTEEMDDVSLFSPCANSSFPIHINPFEFPEGMKLSDHINRLLDVFNGTFELDPPMPMLLTEGIQNCYEKLLWLPGMINRGQLEYPTMGMLYAEIEALLEKYQYADEVKSNLKSILQVRIGSLLAREMGDIFDVEHSTYKPEEWLENSAVIELASLGTGPSNFLMLMLMTLVRETLDIIPYKPAETGGRPRHVIFLEEAHNLISETTSQQPGSMDPKISATAFVTKMLAEVRALGESIVIADQLPTAMAMEVVKNTSLKIALRLTAQDERQYIGATMSADEVQMERMGLFNPGNCLVSYEGLQKPFELQLPEYKNDDVIGDNELLIRHAMHTDYLENITRSVSITISKTMRKMRDLQKNDMALRNYLKRYSGKWMAVDMDVSEESKKEGEQYKRRANVEFDKRIKSWYKLTLELLLYMSVSNAIASVLTRILKEDGRTKQEREQAEKNLRVVNKNMDYENDLRKKINALRKDLEKTALDVSLDNLQEAAYEKQWDLIAAEWKRY